MKVKYLRYNWRQVGSVNDSNGCGDDYDLFRVGENGCISIEENDPNNGLQKWNYVATFEDGTKKRVFDPNLVEYYSD